MVRLLTSPSLPVRVAAAYAIYVVLLLISFAIGYFLLPRGALLHMPWTAAADLAGSPGTPVGEFLATVGINLLLALALGVGLNLQRVRGFPTGYTFLFASGLIGGLVAGSNSFTSQAISPYTVEGWIVSLRVQHLELLGFASVVASTISVGLTDFSSWLPWRAKESSIQHWRAIRFTRAEVAGMLLGVVLILVAAYNETVLTA